MITVDKHFVPGVCWSCGGPDDTGRNIVRIVAKHDDMKQALCLCTDCRHTLASQLLGLDRTAQGTESNATVFLKVFAGAYPSDLWSKGPVDFYKWCSEEYKGGYKGYDEHDFNRSRLPRSRHDSRIRYVLHPFRRHKVSAEDADYYFIIGAFLLGVVTGLAPCALLVRI